MLTITILIIVVSFDAMSFGLAQGLKNIKICFCTLLLMTILSTILFTIPLYISKFIANFFEENTLNIINGIALLIMAIIYLLLFIKDIKINENYEINKTDIKIMPYKSALIATFPISIDAIFTALLNGYSLEFLFAGVIIYFFITFFSLFVTNYIGLKLSRITTMNLGWISSIIFFIIGTLKLLGI